MPAATTLMTMKIMMTQRYICTRIHKYIDFFHHHRFIDFLNVAEKQGGTINHWQVNIKYILYTARHTIVSFADNDIKYGDNLYTTKKTTTTTSTTSCVHTFIKCRLVTSMTDVLSIFVWHYVYNVRVQLNCIFENI